MQLPGQLRGNSQTYNWDSMLVGNYANTLLNTSFEFPAYIRHAYSKNLFENLDDEHVMLGVAAIDHQGHLKDTIPTGHEHLAVVRVFSTEEELLLLMDSVPKWDKAGAIPCTTKSNMSEIDFILVYSKDLETDAKAKSMVCAIEDAFHNDAFGWMSCFPNMKNMSAKLNPEQDVCDNRGYTTNKHWVSGSNAVFSKIMMAMMEREFNDTYDIFFLMEMTPSPSRTTGSTSSRWRPMRWRTMAWPSAGASGVRCIPQHGWRQHDGRDGLRCRIRHDYHGCDVRAH